MIERALVVIAALLFTATLPAGEEYMPLNPGWSDRAGSGWQRATSIDAGSAGASPEVRKNLVRLKMPIAKSAGETRVRLIEAASASDGRLDFSKSRLETPPPANTAGAAIPGLVTPEQLAMGRYRLEAAPDASDAWLTTFPDNVRQDFPDWGGAAWPGLPVPELPDSTAVSLVGDAKYSAPPTAIITGNGQATKEHPPAARSLRPPDAFPETPSRLRPPTAPGQPDGTIRPTPGDQPIQPRERFPEIAPAWPAAGPGQTLTAVGMAPFAYGEFSSSGQNDYFRPGESQADYFRQAANLDPAQFPDYAEPIRWPEPLPPGPADFRSPPMAAGEPDRIRSRRAKSAGITPIRELKNALQPIQRAAGR